VLKTRCFSAGPETPPPPPRDGPLVGPGRRRSGCSLRYRKPMGIAETQPQTRGPLSNIARQTRILRVIAGADFKLKYSGSALGYVWSVAKPLALFSMLYAVFGHVFRLGSISNYYPLSLLMGIVLFTFFSDGTTLGLWSLVARESLLRKMSFPRTIIPTSATLTAAITFGVNSVVVAAFVAWNEIGPRWTWFLLIPLLLELYLLVLGISLILSALFVRLRDVSQVWELVLQLLFYASPIIYPIGFLPPFARKLVFLNPATQVLQDIRAVILYPDLAPNRITINTAFGSPFARLLPIGIVLGILLIGFFYFRREEPWFAERV
jgi:ABC-2 type transport system permease protein